MIERAKTMKFAPGALVFPGGKVDRSDGQNWRWQGITTGRGAHRDIAFRVAALRELYEEAGVLQLDRAPTRPLPTRMAFSELILRSRAKLDTEGILPFAHWVTPEPMPRRFDTHFYLAPHGGGEVRHDGNEAISFCWVNPRNILQNWARDKVPLMFPTRLNLMKLARASTVAQALRQARQAAVVRTMPVINMHAGGVDLTIEKAAGYGVTAATAKEVAVEAGKLA